MSVRKVLTIFVVIAGLLCQAAAFAFGEPRLEDAIHAASQVGAAHHHEDDGSTHFDFSDESLQHMQADHCAASAGPLPGAPALAASPLRHTLTAARGLDPPVPPFLEGPDRPPRHRA